MPTTLYWVGGDSGNENDFATAANWRDDSDDSVALAAPASDDIVVVSHPVRDPKPLKVHGPLRH